MLRNIQHKVITNPNYSCSFTQTLKPTVPNPMGVLEHSTASGLLHNQNVSWLSLCDNQLST